MARYYKIDKSKGRDTDVMLICVHGKELGWKVVSKYYKTDLKKNYQSYVMLTDHIADAILKLEREGTDAVEITADEFVKESERLKDQLC